MQPAQAGDAIRQILQQIQQNQGLECPALTDAVRPIRDLKNFDSPTSLAATGMVARVLALKIDARINLFGDKNGLYSISQSVALLCKLADEQKSKEPAHA
jgi:hypothetical protein